MAAFETIEAQLQLTADSFQSGISNAASSLDTLSSKSMSASKAVAGLGVGLGAVAAGGMAKSIGAAADLDAALTESQAIMGELSSNEMQQMEQAARDVGKTTTFSASEAGDAFYYLASAGMDTQQSVAAVGDVAQFAQAGAFDLATATDLATDAQSALGLSADDAAENQENLNRVMDTLVGANQLANASVEEFSSALTNKAAAAMREAGIEIEEGTSALAVFADQGLKGNKAGTILARTIQGLQSAAQENAGAFERLGVSVYDADGNMRPMVDIVEDMEAGMEGMSTEQRNAAMAQLGLNERAAQGIGLMMGNSEKMREYEGELQNAGGAAEEVANNQLKSFNAQMDLLKSQITDVGISIGNVLLPHLTTLVSGISTAVAWFGALNDKTSGLAGTFVLLSGILVGVVSAAALLAPVFAGLAATVAGAVIPAIAGLATAFTVLTGPIGLVVLALAALAVAYKKNLFGFGDAVDSVVARIKPALAAAGEAFHALVGRIQTALATIRAAIQTGLTVILGVWNAVWPTLQQVIEVVWGVISTIVTTYLATVRTVIQTGLTAILGVWNTVWPVLQQVIEVVWGAISTIVTTYLGAVYTILQTYLGLVRQAWDAVWPVLSQVVETYLGAIYDIVTRYLGFVADAVTTYLQFAYNNLVAGLALMWSLLEPFLAGILALWEQHGDAIVATLQAAYDALVGLVESGLEAVRQAIDIAFGAILELWAVHGDAIIAETEATFGFLLEFVQAVLDLVMLAITTVLDEIKLFWDRWGDEIMAIVSAAWDAYLAYIQWVVDLIWQYVQWGLNNLLTVIQWGLDNIKAFWDVWGKDIVAIVTFLFETVVTIVQGALDFLVTTIRVILAVIRGDWEGAWDLVVGYFERTWDRIVSIATSFADVLVGTITTLVETIVGWFETLYQKLVGGSIVPDLVAKIVDYITGLKDAVIQLVTDLVTKFVDYITELKDTVVDLVIALKDSVVDTVTAMKDLAVDLVIALKDAAMGVFGEFLSDLISWGSDMASEIKAAFEDAKSFAEGVVTSMKDSVVGIIKKIGSEGANAFKSAFNNAIPSSVSVPSVTVAGKTYGGGPVKLPSLATGGHIEQGGLAMLHAGEDVVPAAQVDRNRDSDNGGSTVLRIDAPDDALLRVDEFESLINEHLSERESRKLSERRANPR